MYKILIDISKKVLYLKDEDTIVKTYSIAVGKPESPTPKGKYKIIEMYQNPGGPFGSRWMRFFKTFGIHGTDSPWSIGYAASHGCVRMNNKDVNELYSLVRIGTEVEII